MVDDFYKTSDCSILLSEGYKILKKLGEGTYGWVYLAEHSVTNSESIKENIRMACKVIDTTHSDKTYIRKFLPREISILSKINHPYIIHIQNIYQRNTKFFIFMRYAENGDLLDFILERGILSEAQARLWTRQLGSAVQYLHELEIAHRDLKCENVLISLNYNIKLSDFGFARYVIDSKRRQITSETYCGSLNYLAPEILRGRPYHPKISDMWSIGVIIYVVLNKAMPFTDEGDLVKYYNHQMEKQWKFRPKIGEILSESLKELVENLLEPNVKKRWTIEQVLDSEWMAMRPTLLEKTVEESNALNKAKDKKLARPSVSYKPVNVKKKKKGVKDPMVTLKKEDNIENSRPSTSTPYIMDPETEDFKSAHDE